MAYFMPYRIKMFYVILSIILYCYLNHIFSAGFVILQIIRLHRQLAVRSYSLSLDDMIIGHYRYKL